MQDKKMNKPCAPAPILSRNALNRGPAPGISRTAKWGAGLLLAWTLCPAAGAAPALEHGPYARRPADRPVFVDKRGVLRWRDDRSEVALFGVNYYPPFFRDYMAIKARGLDPKNVIRQDVTHFVRLGLTSIRLHCFDREISDPNGNLVDNEHLELLDYLLAQCKANGMYALLTPIAWWPTPLGKSGFSNRWTMPEMTSDPRAWKAETRYLRQFVSHVNRFTGLAYKDDPGILGFETINEPIYPPGTPDAKVIEYINTLVRAIRSTGCRKPIFHSYFTNRLTAVGASEADGVTFGWYPTGLVAGHMRTENFLPQVADFPAMRAPALAHKVKAVYEFDAADVQWPYLYPAIARAFRRGGCQAAHQFQYEPLAIAATNPNWQTHYLNLCYTPKKALSFAIAAEVFRRIPRGKRFGPYPRNNRFGPFRVSYEKRLSEMAAPDAFLYSNDTRTMPPAPDKLERVWGCGSSPVVKYAGAGAYFLDRLGKGRWLLEVYPDAVLVADPYTGGNNEKVRILWVRHEMTVRLPDLGPRFYVRHVSPAGAGAGQARLGRFEVAPGRYLLSASPAGHLRIPLPPFMAPAGSKAPPAVWLRAPGEWREGTALPVRVSVAGIDIRRCVLHFRPAGAPAFSTLPMQRTAPYQWTAAVPPERLAPGVAGYFITVTGRRTYWFPGGRTAPPPKRKRPPLALMRVNRRDRPPRVHYSGPKGNGARARIVPGRSAAARALRIEADGFGPPPSCVSARWPAAPLPKTLAGYNAVRFVVRGGPETSAVEIGLVQKDGNAFGYDVPLSPIWNAVTVPLHRLRPLWSTKASSPRPERIAEISLIFGAWLLGDAAPRPHWIEVQSVELLPRPAQWEVRILRRTDPIVLLRPAQKPVRLLGGPYQTRLVPGMTPGARAVRFSVRGFGPAPDCRTLRAVVPSGVRQAARRQLARATAVVITARAGFARTRAVELALIESDGAPWGVVVPLTPHWRALRIPLSRLRYFGHWHPPCRGRGGPGDRFHPENLAMINLCFGAFLVPKTHAQPQAIELEKISLIGPESAAENNP